MKISVSFLFLLSFLFVIASSVSSELYSFSNDETVIGVVRTYKVKAKESLIEIARKFGLGYNEITDANLTLDPFIPGKDASVIIPALWVLPDAPLREGIVINLSEMRLFYFLKQKGEWKVRTFPIGIGDEGNNTPVGNFVVIQKIERPSWHVPKSIKKERPELPDVVPPGPNNPLGSHALRLSLGSYLIHGTNRPWAVGRRVTHGCIRLYPEDMLKLFNMASNGVKVTIVIQPVKVGVKNNRVYVEVHKDDYGENINYFKEAAGLLKEKNLFDKIDAEKLYNALEEKSGVPGDISK
ncbi:MAG: L,D-transpeptidase family protein [Thermodesulfovibrionales bacterium]|nr:L,D-transpeptidase family protein [Thermodesulfovibrionales bacterium]